MNARAQVNYYMPGASTCPLSGSTGRILPDPRRLSPPVTSGTTLFARPLTACLAVPSPIRINVEQYVGVDSVHVSFDVVCVDSVPKPLWLNFAVAEWGHFYTTRVFPRSPSGGTMP